MELSSDVIWTIAIAVGSGFVVWLIRMERLTTQLVEHGKASHERHDKAEERLEGHEKRISRIENMPAQGFNAQ